MSLRRATSSAAFGAMGLLAACATSPSTRLGAPVGSRGAPLPSPSPPAVEAARAPSGGAAFAALPGWAEEDHAAALRAFQSGCAAARDPAMRQICAKARALGPNIPDGAAKQFFQFNFVPAPLPGEGVLTAYFSPEYPARRAPEGAFTAPVRPRPAGQASAPFASAPTPGDDPVDGLLQGSTVPSPPLALAPRADIEAAPAPDALAWMRPEDLFFLQVQGSGVLLFPDGGRAKALYAGDNGRPFTAIARPMVQAGDLPAGRASADAIRAWLATHAGPQAQAVMDLDARYVFFRLVADDGRDPAGAAGVPLTAGRALAVDPSRHGYGELYWIDASAPGLNGAFPR